jgi:alkanesulfonate monooxygenase SsuD/methylene tetrahydromethanopterin reductase-like flavin-dependent oxidoreductase (luciferase family)
MGLGIFNLMNEHGIEQREVFDTTLACVRLADDLGFDIAWFAEHHFSNYSLCPSPLMMAAAAARETRRIGLGPAVVVAPLYNPIRVAEELALLDQLSRGRAVLGIGSGYQRFEFDAFGADLAERYDRMLEVWQIIDQAVHNNRFSYTGKHYQLPDVPQAIRLYRPRQVESFFVAWTPAIIRQAVKVDAVPFVTVGWGDGQALKAMRDTVAGKYREAGFDLAGRRFAAQRYVFVSDDRAEVRKAAEGARYAGRCAGHMRVGKQVLDGHRIRDMAVEGEPDLEQIEAQLPIGDAQTVAERLVREIREVGITDLSCFMWPAGVEPRAVLRSMERFGAEVMPQVQKALAANQAAPVREVA